MVKNCENVSNNTENNMKKEGIESVEEKLGRTTGWMHQVQELEKENVNVKMMRGETVNLIRRRIGQSCAELEDIRDILVDSVREKLSPRQLAVLEEGESNSDPSVQFFGIEWEGVFARCFNLGLNMRIFKQHLSAEVVDNIGLSAILTELSGVEAELGDHLVALLSGRLARGQTDLSIVGQTDELEGRGKVKYRKNKTENLVKIWTNQVKKTDDSISRPVKYRKNKTENLTEKISSSQTQDSKNRRKSTVNDTSTIKKKNSFLHKVSNVFIDYI